MRVSLCFEAVGLAHGRFELDRWSRLSEQLKARELNPWQESKALQIQLESTSSSFDICLSIWSILGLYHIHIIYILSYIYLLRYIVYLLLGI